MKNEKILEKINRLLNGSGVVVNGPNPWDLQIKDQFVSEFYYRVMKYGSLGLGESYMDEWWNCEKLDQFFTRILSIGLDKTSKTWRMFFPYLESLILNLQTRTGSTNVINNHYDLSPRLYESFLDPYNQYTCGYFSKGCDLNEAQERKLHLICQKLHISNKDSVLDVGCGWGGFAKFAAQNYNCSVTGITLSKEQAKYARNFTRGLPVTVVEMDYRDLGSENYKKILVCGMIEHVGKKNYRKFMKIIHKSLADDGLFLLHTIGGLESVTQTDPWIDKYIFPNSMIPSVKQIINSTEGLFTLQDVHNFGPSYDLTLMAWYENFKNNWNKIKSDYYDERFRRMWEYYLLSSAASFRVKNNQLYQFVFSKNLKEEYVSIR